MKLTLFILAAIILLAMAGYAVYLLLALKKQRQQIQKLQNEARQARVERLTESIDIIAKAMQTGDCNLSEGVLRLKMLLDPLGNSLKNYPAMFALYETVQDMPTHEARRELKKNERMRLDLERESKEVELEEDIQKELNQLLQDIAKLK